MLESSGGGVGGWGEGRWGGGRGVADHSFKFLNLMNMVESSGGGGGGKGELQTTVLNF